MHKEIVPVTEAIGKMLSHDVTKIVRGEFKGALLRKGHIITEADVEALRLAGKEHVYILELAADEVHEDEAGSRLGQGAAGAGIELVGPVESRVNLKAKAKGLLKIKVSLLEELNALPGVVMATLPTNSVVQPGQIVAGTKVIPLVVKEEIIQAAEKILQKAPIVQVKPFLPLKAGIIITGREVYDKKIEDAFGPVISEKVAAFGCEVIALDYAPDDAQIIANLVKQQVSAGAQIIIATGGMSVDPDDVTPTGISLAGAELIQYGAPVLPGAMFLLAYLGDIPILGVPACGMYYRTTIFDLVLPRILAGEKMTKQDILGFAHGGLCRSCPECHYPACSFGCGGQGVE